MRRVGCARARLPAVSCAMLVSAMETDLETYEALTTASLILSGASLLTASVLFIFEPGATEEAEAAEADTGTGTATVSLGFGPGSVQLDGRF